MRTYDKLIATIRSSQGKGGLRPSFGSSVAVGGVVPPVATPQQDSA
ncbi:hypothetical protein [Chitiniphilus shinanonensis]|nr:hypothetical protein [Chitiniphilus shinanonensis]